MEWSLAWMLVLTTLMVVAMIVGYLYYVITWQYDYWRKRKVPYLEPSFPFGNIKDILFSRIDIGRFYERIYKQFKGQKYGGFFEFHTPTLILTDLDMIRHVMNKDFVYFMDRALPPRSSEFLTKHLFSMEGKEWKEMRTKLTPVYSSGKTKLMYTLIEKCSEQLKQHLENLASESAVVDVKELMSKFTIDTIATCAFGLKVNTLADSNNEFYEISQLMFKPSKMFLFKRFFIGTFSKTAKLLKLTMYDPKLSDFILNLVKSTVNFRELSGVYRNDFLDLLIKVKNNQSLDEHHNGKPLNFTKDYLTMEEMAAQSFMFLAAGFETAASTLTFVLYELALHPEIQERLRREVDQVKEKNGGKITYQALQEMAYLDQVINESMRMHGSGPVLFRKCVEPYMIPGTNITLDKNVKVTIPLYAIHNDPDIYPDPEKFDPERFTEENMRTRHSYSFLPFGDGPRMCIGMRFGKMQIKAALTTIISNFELHVTEETPIPVEISPYIIITCPLHPIKLRITERSY